MSTAKRSVSEAALNLLTEQDRAETRGRGAGAGRHVGRAGGACPALPRGGRGCTTLWPRKMEIRGSLAQAADAASRPPLANHVEPRGSSGPAQRRRRAYPRLFASLLRAQGQVAGTWTRCRSGTVTRLCRWKRLRIVPWDEARKMVTDAFAGFDPRMAETGRALLHQRWIDAGVKEGGPGAFAHPTVTRRASLRDAELPRQTAGCHDRWPMSWAMACHQRLAARPGEMLSSTPLTLAGPPASSARC